MRAFSSGHSSVSLFMVSTVLQQIYKPPPNGAALLLAVPTEFFSAAMFLLMAMCFNGLVVANCSPFFDVHSGSSISTSPTRFRLSMSTVGESTSSLYIVIIPSPNAMLIIASSGYIAGSTQLLNIDMHAIWVAISDHTSSQVHANIRSKCCCCVMQVLYLFSTHLGGTCHGTNVPGSIMQSSQGSKLAQHARVTSLRTPKVHCCPCKCNPETIHPLHNIPVKNWPV
jgi:hypothetical protein